MELGKELDTSVVENKIAGQQPHQCALLIYTVSPIIMSNHCRSTFFFLDSLAPLVHLKL